MEPKAAHRYAEMAKQAIYMNQPIVDKRAMYSWRDMGAIYRVNENNVLDPNGAISVLRIDAPIAKYDYCGSPGSQTMQQLLDSMQADPTVKAIVLRIDSPGGQVDGTEALANTVKSMKKPVVAFTDGMMASAAYWIGSSAKEIISSGYNNGFNETIGSIGTMAMWADYSKQLENDGVTVHTVFATDSVDKWADFRKANAGDYTDLIKQLDGLNATFLNAVKDNRGAKLDLNKENVLTGKTYNSKEALRYGLIDRIGTLDYAVRRAHALARKQELQQNYN